MTRASMSTFCERSNTIGVHESSFFGLGWSLPLNESGLLCIHVISDRSPYIENKISQMFGVR